MSIIVISKNELENILTQQMDKIISKLNDLYPKEVVSQGDQLLTRKEAAKMLQISLPTLHHYTKSGMIKSKRVGNSVRYSIEDIKASVVDRKFKKGGYNE